jgi:hypothetical protein
MDLTANAIFSDTATSLFTSIATVDDQYGVTSILTPIEEWKHGTF